MSDKKFSIKMAYNITGNGKYCSKQCEQYEGGMCCTLFGILDHDEDMQELRDEECLGLEEDVIESENEVNTLYTEIHLIKEKINDIVEKHNNSICYLDGIGTNARPMLLSPISIDAIDEDGLSRNDILFKIYKKLDIFESNTDISSGGSVNYSGLLKIIMHLSLDYRGCNTKKSLLEVIFKHYNIKSDDADFSATGVVSKMALLKILEKI